MLFYDAILADEMHQKSHDIENVALGASTVMGGGEEMQKVINELREV